MDIKPDGKPISKISFDIENQEKKPSILKTLDKYLSVIFNVVKNGLGACALFLGGGFASGGIITSSLLLVLVGILCASTFYYLGLCCRKTNLSSYKEIFEIAVGKKYGIILSLIMFTMTFLIVLIYMVCISMFANEFFIEFIFDVRETYSTFVQEVFVFLIIGVCIAVPCSFFTNINSYKYRSFIGFIAYIYVSILLIIIACMGLRNNDKEEISYAPGGHGIPMILVFGFIGVMGQAYTCHYNTPNFYKQCGEDPKLYKNITIISFSIIFLINFIMGFFAYYNFGSQLFQTGAPCILFVDNSLNSAKYVGMFLISLNMAFGVGITLFPNRIAINELYQKLILKDETSSGTDISPTRHIAITLTLIIMLVVVSIICVYTGGEGFNVLAMLVSIACSIFGPFIAFIFPSICYIRICKPDMKKKAYAFFIIFFGVLSFISGTMDFIGRKIIL